jgi:hypothetical protein
MLRHAEMPKGPRRVPTVACDGSKNGHLTAPRVGFFFFDLCSAMADFLSGNIAQRRCTMMSRTAAIHASWISIIIFIATFALPSDARFLFAPGYFIAFHTVPQGPHGGRAAEVVAYALSFFLLWSACYCLLLIVTRRKGTPRHAEKVRPKPDFLF